jgi:hypothetical protein
MLGKGIECWSLLPQIDTFFIKRGGRMTNYRTWMRSPTTLYTNACDIKHLPMPL